MQIQICCSKWNKERKVFSRDGIQTTLPYDYLSVEIKVIVNPVWHQSKLLCLDSLNYVLAEKIVETASDDTDCLSWLIDYIVFYVMIKNISIIWTGDVTITGEGQQNLGLCSVLKAFEQEDRATPAATWSLGLSGLIRRSAPFNRLLRHTREYGGSILTRILLYSAEWCKCTCSLLWNSDWIIKTKTVCLPIYKLIFNT